MTPQEHPLTPPPELVQQWRAEWRAERLKVGDTNCEQWGYATARAARWGYDQAIKELETFLEKAND